MIRRISMLVAVLAIAAPSLFAQRATEVAPTFRCESTDGHYRECRFGGFGTVALTRTLSKAECVQGRSWDTHDDVVWVDRGCRAEFAVSGTERAGRRMNRRNRNIQRSVVAQTITCGTGRKARQNCAADTSYGVYMNRQLSSDNCTYNRDWGYDQNGIWAQNGCRAEFVTGDANTYGNLGGMSSARYTSLVVCESQNGKRHTCSADTRYGVDVYRQLSKAECVFNSTWGYDSRGIWVDRGCRAEFALDRTAP
jgi:hypothetical protein